MTLFYNPNLKVLTINANWESHNFKKTIKNLWMQSRNYKLSMIWSKILNNNNREIYNKY